MVNNKIYACKGTFSGGLLGSASNICDPSYEICKSIPRLNFLGLTQNKCANISTQNEFYATLVSSLGFAQCNINEYNSSYQNDIWGCGATGPIIPSLSDIYTIVRSITYIQPPGGSYGCGNILTAFISSDDNLRSWHAGNWVIYDQNNEINSTFLTNSQYGGVMCCIKETKNPTKIPTYFPTQIPTKIPSKIPTNNPTNYVTDYQTTNTVQNTTFIEQTNAFTVEIGKIKILWIVLIIFIVIFCGVSFFFCLCLWKIYKKNQKIKLNEIELQSSTNQSQQNIKPITENDEIIAEQWNEHFHDINNMTNKGVKYKSEGVRHNDSVVAEVWQNHLNDVHNTTNGNIVQTTQG